MAGPNPQEAPVLDVVLRSIDGARRARKRGEPISDDDHDVVLLVPGLARRAKQHARRQPCVACRRPVADALVLPHLVACPAVEARERAERLGLEAQAVVEAAERGLRPPLPSHAGPPPRPAFFPVDVLACLPYPGAMEHCAELAVETLLGLEPAPGPRRPVISISADELEQGLPGDRIVAHARTLDGAVDVLTAIALADAYAEVFLAAACPWCGEAVPRGLLERHLPRCEKHPEHARAARLERWLKHCRGPAPLPIAATMADLQRWRSVLTRLVVACDAFSSSFGWNGEGAYVKDFDEREFQKELAWAFAPAREQAP